MCGAEAGEAAGLHLWRPRYAADPAQAFVATFASYYSHVVSLQEALQIPNLLAYNRRATGEKFLIAPHKAG